jgi:hypothetical protein
MSRTIKDMRATKVARPSKEEEPVRQSYRKAKRNGFFSSSSDEDHCPECGGLTNFQNGFLTCSECNWSTFETEELCFGPFEPKTAI